MAAFNCWANDIVCGWLGQISEEQWQQELVSSFNSVSATVLHVAGAEKAWLERCQGQQQVVPLSKEFAGNKAELLARWQEIYGGLKTFVEQFEEDRLAANLVFKRFNGEENAMPYWQVFAHVFNHSTYHRGQLVTLLRQVGFTRVGSTDLLGFYRSKN